MRSELRRAGAALTSVAALTAGAYLVAIVTDGQANPIWPFFMPDALAPGGAIVFLVIKPDSRVRLTKEYVMDRLVLGFNSCTLRIELAASKARPDDYAYPTTGRSVHFDSE